MRDKYGSDHYHLINMFDTVYKKYKKPLTLLMDMLNYRTNSGSGPGCYAHSCVIKHLCLYGVN